MDIDLEVDAGVDVNADDVDELVDVVVQWTLAKTSKAHKTRDARRKDSLLRLG